MAFAGPTAVWVASGQREARPLALDICHGEFIVVDGHVDDIPIPREVSHVDNNLPIVLFDYYNFLLTPASKISNMSYCVDAVKAILSKGLAEDIPIDEVQNHNPMTWYVPYHPVFKRSGDIYFVFDCSNRSREYSFNDCVFHTLDNLSNFACCSRQHEVALSVDVPSVCNQVLLPHHAELPWGFCGM